MREIKFRAWSGKYMSGSVYGDWVSFDGVPYTEANKKHNTPNIEIQKAKNYVLMQFTGLRDKNGKEIYEGDLLTDSACFKWQVFWYEDHACFGVKSTANDNVVAEIIDNINMIIIGNVYEHPNLYNP